MLVEGRVERERCRVERDVVECNYASKACCLRLYVEAVFTNECK